MLFLSQHCSQHEASAYFLLPQEQYVGSPLVRSSYHAHEQAESFQNR